MAKKKITRFDNSLTNDPFFTSMGKTIDLQDDVLEKYGFEVFEDIVNDPFLYGCYQSRLNNMESQEWEIIANDATEKEIEIVTESMDMLIQNGIISKIMKGRFVSPTGIYLDWKTDDYWYPYDCDIINSERIKFDSADGSLRILTKSDRMSGVAVDGRNFIIAVDNETKSNPYGTSLLSKAYLSQYIKKKLLNFWAVFAEKYGMPWVIAKINEEYAKTKINDPEFNPDEVVDEVLETIDNTITDGVLVGKSGVDVEVSQPVNQSTDIFSTFRTELKKDISVLILGHENAAMATAGQLGNRNEAITVRKDILDSDKVYVQRYLGKIIDYIYELNFGESKNKAYIRFYQKENTDQYIAKADITNKLAENNKVVFSKDYYKEQFNLKDSDIEDVNVSPIQPFNPGVQAANNKLMNMISRKEFVNAGQEPDSDSVEFENYVANSKKYKNAVNKQLRPILDLVQNSKDYDTLMANLFELYPEMDIDDLQEVLIRAVLTTHIKGFSDSEIESEE